MIQAIKLIKPEIDLSKTVVDVEIADKNVSLVQGESYTLTFNAFEVGSGFVPVEAQWNISDTNVASISDDGEITGVDVGTVEVEGVHEDLEASILISVNSPSLQAVRNNLKKYFDGIALDGGWNNFSNFDVYMLETQGAETEDWERNNTNLRIESLARADEVLTTTGTYSVKRIAQDLLAAKAYGENNKVSDLLDVIKSEQAKDPLFGSVYTAASAYGYLAEANLIDELDADAVVTALIEEQRSAADGNEGGFVKGQYGPDFMSTTSILRTLNALKSEVSGSTLAELNSALDKGLSWLKTYKQTDGSIYPSGGWDDPLVDTVEVMWLMDDLNIDFDDEEWSTSGVTVVDYLNKSAMNSNKSFGSAENITDNTYAMLGFSLVGNTIPNDSTLYISLSDDNVSIKEGATFDFEATAHLLDGTKENVSNSAYWNVVSGSSKLESLGKGVFKATDSGNATVKVYSDGCEETAEIEISETSGGGNDTSNESTINVKIIALYCEKGKELGSDELSDYKSYEYYKVRKNGKIVITRSIILLILISNSSLVLQTSMDYCSWALDKSHVSYKFASDNDGFVKEIKGHRNTGVIGWMYTVNNHKPGVLAGDYDVEDNDKVLWIYSLDGDSVLTWNEAVEICKRLSQGTLSVESGRSTNEAKEQKN